MRLDGQTVVITGANGSLGKIAVARCLELGAEVKALDLDFSNTTLTAGASCELLSVDLLDLHAVENRIADMGTIDVLLNLAGGFSMGNAVHETTPEDFLHMYDINVSSLLNTVRSVVPVMLAKSQGSIVNVGAKAALQGSALMGAYIAAKSSVLRLTECMAEELKQRGIRVNAVLPSIIDTPANRAAMPDEDHGLWVAPEDLVNTILYLASGGANAVTGALLPVTGRL